MSGLIVPVFGLVLAVTVCASAFWKGGREEQVAAGGLLMSWAVTVALRDQNWAGIQWGAFAADLCLLTLLTALAMRTPRYWPLAAAAFQLLCVVTHVARIVDPGVRAWAYATGQVIWSQLVFLALGVGVWNLWRESRQPISDDDRLLTDPGAMRR